MSNSSENQSSKEQESNIDAKSKESETTKPPEKQESIKLENKVPLEFGAKPNSDHIAEFKMAVPLRNQSANSSFN